MANGSALWTASTDLARDMKMLDGIIGDMEGVLAESVIPAERALFEEFVALLQRLRQTGERVCAAVLAQIETDRNGAMLPS